MATIVQVQLGSDNIGDIGGCLIVWHPPFIIISLYMRIAIILTQGGDRNVRYCIN